MIIIFDNYIHLYTTFSTCTTQHFIIYLAGRVTYGLTASMTKLLVRSQVEHFNIESDLGRSVCTKKNSKTVLFAHLFHIAAHLAPVVLQDLFSCIFSAHTVLEDLCQCDLEILDINMIMCETYIANVCIS